MSDRTPNDSFDGLDTDDLRFGFPGAEPDGLTEEERAFTIDGGDLSGTPRVARSSPAEREEALLSALSKQSKKKAEAEKTAADRVDALAGAFQKLARRGRTPPEAPPPEKKTTRPPAPEPPPPEPAPVQDRPAPEPDKPVPAPGKNSAAEKMPARRKNESPASPAGRKRRANRRGEEILMRAEPVTIGRDLRMDEMLVYDSELDDIDYTDEEDLPEARDYLPIRFGRHGRVGVAGGILYALFVISVSVVLACVAWMFAADVLALGKEPQTAVVVIDTYEPEGDDPLYETVNDTEVPIKVDIDQVANELKGAGVIQYKWLFKLFSQFSHANTKIDPGTYSVSTALDYRAIVTTLQFGSGSQEITKVTFPEGFSTEQIFTLLEENHICQKTALYDAAANYDFGYDFLEELELGDPNRLEGYLFPDTYEFYQGEDATVAINRFLRNFSNKFDDDMRDRAARMGYSVHEILTIASLIEKESANADESPHIASVIYNRLNAGWKLQLDSTINYINGTSTFDISIADTEIDDPYNTYLYEGLPPGPICNPGLSSIEAALYPDSTNDWYWYAADGETHFFTNYDDFNAFANAHPY